MAVAEELHFGRAAERLHIAQPSLSSQVRRLESQLGVTLLRRTSRRVELTQAGETMLRDGRRLLAHARRVTEAARRASADVLTVGFYGSAGTAVLARAIPIFVAEHPGTELAIRELRLGELDAVIEARVDLAFTRLRPDQVVGMPIDVELLCEEPRVVVLPRDHALAARRALTFGELAGERFVINPAVRGLPAARWEAEQRRHGLSAEVAAQASSIQELLTFVASGIGISLVAESVARQHRQAELAYVPVLDAEPAVISLARPRTRPRPIDEAFMTIARNAAGAPALDAAIAPG